MQQHKLVRGGNAGFTLLEVLVALVLIGLLVGTLVPAVLNQMSRGEVNRVLEDLRGVESAVKSFRVDAQRWPGDLGDLTTTITAADSAFGGAAYPDASASGWKGPYLEGVLVASGDSLATASGGEIRHRFVSAMLGGQEYLTLEVDGLTPETMATLSNLIDGNADLTNGDAGGRVRQGATATTLHYLAASTR